MTVEVAANKRIARCADDLRDELDVLSGTVDWGNVDIGDVYPLLFPQLHPKGLDFSSRLVPESDLLEV